MVKILKIILGRLREITPVIVQVPKPLVRTLLPHEQGVWRCKEKCKKVQKRLFYKRTQKK